MRRVGTRAITACLAFSLLAGGCKAKSSAATTPSAPPGRIEFSVSPATVTWFPLEQPGTFSTYCNAANQTTFGPFVWTLRETGGGTVTVNAFTARATATDGTLISNLTQLIGLLATELTGTSAASFTLQPNQTLTGKERYTCQATQPGAGTPIFWGGSNVLYTASGTDSHSTAVSSSATLNILKVF